MSSLRLHVDNQLFGVQQHGGIARYWTELLPRIARAPDVSLSLDLGWYVTDFPFAQALGDQVELSGRRALPQIPAFFRKMRNAVATRLAGPVPAGEILHTSYYYQFRRRRSGSPLVVTFFDLIQERYPRPSDGRVLAAKKQAAESADLILCISRATADDLGEIYGVPESRMIVTHLGYDPVPLPDPEGRPQERPYLLFVGQRGGYKNFSLLRDAYGTFPELYESLDLVCFGGPPLTRDEMPVNGRIRHLRGSDADLARWYRHAVCLVYPTKYEGFGLPLIEAMSWGCPVVTTTGGSLGEVGGSHAVYVDPEDPEALADAIRRIHRDRPFRDELIAGAIPHARAFTWDSTAESTLAAYRRLTGGS